MEHIKWKTMRLYLRTKATDITQEYILINKSRLLPKTCLFYNDEKASYNRWFEKTCLF